MANEYSYFRAEGVSLKAVHEVKETWRERGAILHNMAVVYRAIDCDYMPAPVMGGWPERDVFFSFYKERVPADFTVDEKDKHAVYINARPTSGTDIARDVDNQLDLIDALMKRSGSLEAIFGCGEMPYRQLEAGIYSHAFVRSQTWVSPWPEKYDASKVKDRDDAGLLHDNGGAGGCSNKSSISDHLCVKELDGVFYIRVPNDEKGRPCMTPPDAVPMAYAEMLAADEREYNKQHPQAPVSRLGAAPRKISPGHYKL